MTLKCDENLKKKLTQGFTNGIRNLVNFHACSQKPENLLLDGLLLSKTYKDLGEKVQKYYVS